MVNIGVVWSNMVYISVMRSNVMGIMWHNDMGVMSDSMVHWSSVDIMMNWSVVSLSMVLDNWMDNFMVWS